MTSIPMAHNPEPPAGPLPNGHGPAAALHDARPDAGIPPSLEAQAAARLSIPVDDWNVMFDAVRTRLMRTVGERLGELPEGPPHSAELSASLVQAVVLDCVSALDQLHAALTQERSQRPTP
jgi:hypothetical protein